VVFVAVGRAEEVAFDVLFPESVEELGRPERMSCEFVEVEVEEEFAANVPVPNMVVEPSVVVLVVDPLVTVERRGEVVMAEEDRVMVEA